jgi:hypothetical protein
MRRPSPYQPGSPQDRTQTGFCIRHGWSKSKYFREKNAGRGPKETVDGARTIRIMPKDEAAFDRARANPNSTEQRLLQRMQANRIAQAKRAAAASLAGPNHVSKQRRRQAQAAANKK